MEIYQLKVFLQVARYLSFTEAADSLNLTQPAVSAKVKSLEAELGASLFYRLGRKVQLTELGLFLLNEAPSLVEQAEILLKKIDGFKQGNSGLIKLGCTPAIAESWAPKLIYDYRQCHAGITTKLRIFETSHDLYEALTSHQIDIGFSEIQFDGFTEISIRPIAQVAYKLVMSVEHPLAGQNWLSIWDLLAESWAIRAEGYASRLVFENRISELGLSLSDFSNLESVDTLSLMKTYIIQGHYLGFVSEFELQDECETGQLVSVSLQEFALSSDVFLILPKRLDQLFQDQMNATRKSKQIVSPLQKLLNFLPDFSDQSRQIQLENSLPRFQSPKYSISIQSQKSTNQVSISIGVQNSTIPTVTAGLVIQKLGLLEHYLPRSGQYSTTAFQIKWCDFALGTPIIEGLHTQKLDIGIVGDYPLLLSAARSSQFSETLDQTYLISFVAINPDGAGNAVFVPQHSTLQTIDDLQGHIIATPFGSSAHGMLIRVLSQLQLSSEVELCPIHQSDPYRFDRHDHIFSGYAHFSPFHEIAHQQGQFRYLFKGDLGELPAFYGVIVRKSFAEYYPDIVISYLKALRAAQHWLTHVPKGQNLISQWIHCRPEVIPKSLNLDHQSLQSGAYSPDLTVRPDWIQDHIHQFLLTSYHKDFENIDLNQWIKQDFLQTISFGTL